MGLTISFMLVNLQGRHVAPPPRYKLLLPVVYHVSPGPSAIILVPIVIILIVRAHPKDIMLVHYAICSVPSSLRLQCPSLRLF